MNTSRNTAFQYEYSSTLSVDAPSYVVRQADRGFYEALKAGQFCYVFNARKMGKSSLMIRTMQRLQAESIGCALIDITMYGCEGVTLEQWYYALIKILLNSKQRTSRLLGLYQQVLARTRDWEDKRDKREKGDKVELPQ